MTALTLALLGACGHGEPSGWTIDAERSAGAATVFDTSDQAYGHPIAGLSRSAERKFFRGKAFFEDPWVAAPASTTSRDGLGPIFNARACLDCHPGLGRGGPPAAGGPMASMLVRTSVETDDGGDAPHPIYGGQIQPVGVDGVLGEGGVSVTYNEVHVVLADDTHVRLHSPVYDLSDLRYGDPGPRFRFSVRAAPPLVGLGLIEAIPEADIVARADPHDDDGDGISGRARLITTSSGSVARLGRFGLKGGTPTLVDQVAAAFAADLGLTSRRYPLEPCAPTQLECLAAPSGGSPELSDEIVDATASYLGALGVPARRDSAVPVVLRGEDVFHEIGCPTCHVPEHTLGEVDGVPGLSGEVIRPYTDLLLHDMGDGLADGRPEGDATGREWRTPPLWGLGLSERVSGTASLLHDGRARNIVEAILWHEGEARASKERFGSLSAADRAYLIEFLGSL